MRCDLRTAVVTASPDGLFWPGRRLLQKRFATASVEPGSGTAAAARSVVGSLRGRCGTENYEPLSYLPVGTRVIGRFHHQQAKAPAKAGQPARPFRVRSDQCTGPGGVVLASW